ncbi:MAG: D-amino-acid transaminase [Alphaproteobacteria bacterium]|jgi:D-alanine transaminase|nr:D-amino-acid transaminase [Rhodospirillaceae bacterium]MBT6511378.1 D-amino-acid transaminase [Rhodospirillaceae bacterium]MBT7647898.1 D-amino-acid transaminase [Rhodospirillaceae bacterium]MDG2483249.1 D-amino-acid transaminase [Alphaproteobacteria bacterium]
MSRVAYVNGRYLPHSKAHVHIDDRAHNFADGVYEVILIVGGRMVDEEGHMVRLARSLRELDMVPPMSDRALLNVMYQTVARNRVQEGLVYLQINRGTSPRNHVYDNDKLIPTVVCTAKTVALPSDPENVAGVKVITRPDNRWERVDIKTVSLLPNAMAKTAAMREGAYEAWFVDKDGFVTECTSSNAWIIDQEGRLVTRPLAGLDILPGITRDRVIKLARENDIEVVERAFSVEEALGAREAFLTSTTSFVKPITQIDDSVIGNGHPGTTTRTLLAAYLEFAQNIALENAA